MPDVPPEPSLARSVSPRPDSRVARLNRLRRLSFYLDNAIEIPGIRYRIGLDPILGLIPGGGDAAGLILSSAIVLEAAQMGAGKSTLVQMVWNILLETVLGTIPIVGDVFDATWKANARNIRLLEDRLNVYHSSRHRNRLFAILLLVGLFLAFAGCLVVSVLILRWVIAAIGN
ncbi:MAG: hypothetical protein Kow00121_34740 [Elainellaceae cyanobacterium]